MKMVYLVLKGSTALQARSTRISTLVPLAPLVRGWELDMCTLLVQSARLGTSASTRRRPASVQSYTRNITVMGIADGPNLTRTCALSSLIVWKVQQMQLAPVLTDNGQSLAAKAP